MSGRCRGAGARELAQRSHGGPPERGGHCGEETPAGSGARVAVGPGFVGLEKGERSWRRWGEKAGEDWRGWGGTVG